VILSPKAASTPAMVDMDLNATTKLDLSMPDNPVTEVPHELDTQVPSGEAAPPMLPEFKLDDINLTMDDSPQPDALASDSGSVKDDHWYDVQTKFDLAKAYQEMGDKDGAREILNEVMQEGDAAQQAEAKQLLSSLG
jgi:pilus assembly protein FimV